MVIAWRKHVPKPTKQECEWMFLKMLHNVGCCLCLLAVLAFAGGCGSSTKSFTLVVLPDTQVYAETYPDIFTCQTQWIVENKEKENIVFVAQEGDIVNHNRPEEWQTARRSMSLLDGVVPYTICVGNHDMGSSSSVTANDRQTLFGEYFPYSVTHKLCRGGFMPEAPQNRYSVFNAGGMEFIVLSLEFYPTDAILEWADGIVRQNPDSRIILLTHGYLFCDGTRLSPATPHPEHCYTPDCYGCGGNDGQQMWDKLVRKHPNMFLVLCGHVAGLYEEQPDPTARLTSTGEGGNTVHQVLSDYQWLANGGNGWLRLMTFVPAENKIYVRTYSPLLKQFWVDDENQFEMEYAMTK